MKRVVLPVVLLLTGCSSLHLPGVRSDFYETQYRGAQALDGNAAAFDRLQTLQADWSARGEQGVAYKLMPWDRGNRDRAAELADATLRVVDARDEVLGQRDLVEVMGNALKDLEAEYDAIAAILIEGEDVSGESIAQAAEQKYLARRMANSLVLMTQSDMTAAVEAADVFGRDVARFQLLLDAAINGNEELGIDPPDSPEVEESLAQIEDLFTGYIADSTEDVLENVVARYDAWRALGDMTAMGDTVFGGGVAAGKKAAADADDSAVDEEAEAGADDMDAGAASDDAESAAEGVEPAMEDGADGDAGETSAGDEGGAEETGAADDAMDDDAVDADATDDGAIDSAEDSGAEMEEDMEEDAEAADEN